MAAKNHIKMEKEEIIQLVTDFLDDVGQFKGFELWLQSRGYSLDELGFQDSD